MELQVIYVLQIANNQVVLIEDNRVIGKIFGPVPFTVICPKYFDLTKIHEYRTFADAKQAVVDNSVNRCLKLMPVDPDFKD